MERTETTPPLDASMTRRERSNVHAESSKRVAARAWAKRCAGRKTHEMRKGGTTGRGREGPQSSRR
eukprot:14059539-Alexandrium_andersonii.AAC.1